MKFSPCNPLRLQEKSAKGRDVVQLANGSGRPTRVISVFIYSTENDRIRLNSQDMEERNLIVPYKPR